MANHGYISSKRDLVPEQVYADLQAVNIKRFGGLLQIDQHEDGKSWFIGHEAGYRSGFNIWIKSTRKLEHRHSSGWAFYLEVVFSNELSQSYSGKISDDGVNEKWDGKPEKYPTYRSWCESQYSHCGFLLRKTLITADMKCCPKALRRY